MALPPCKRFKQIHGGLVGIFGAGRTQAVQDRVVVSAQTGIGASDTQEMAPCHCLGGNKVDCGVDRKRGIGIGDENVDDGAAGGFPKGHLRGVALQALVLFGLRACGGGDCQGSHKRGQGFHHGILIGNIYLSGELIGLRGGLSRLALLMHRQFVRRACLLLPAARRVGFLSELPRLARAGLGLSALFCFGSRAAGRVIAAASVAVCGAWDGPRRAAVIGGWRHG